MTITQSQYTVAELCARIDAGDLTVNKSYQRSSKVWPETARSFLIETVILGYPVPKLMLWERTSVQTLKTTREIVDGQQRTFALYEYVKGHYPLSNTVETAELKGRRYDQLDETSQTKLVTYALGLDVLVGSDEADVREIFRRLNSYTVPLNPEEHRHAVFQGVFKWFISELAKDSSPSFQRLGTFKSTDFVRMRDAKLLTEVMHSIDAGIETTNKTKLNGMYRKYDASYPNKDAAAKMIAEGLEYLESVLIVKGSALAKPYNVYGLLLAFCVARSNEPKLAALVHGGTHPLVHSKIAAAKLQLLVDALDVDADEEGPFPAFVAACREKTNTRENRLTRFNWYYRAITGQELA